MKLHVITLDGLQWTPGGISGVDSQSDGRDRTMLLLHKRRDKI